MGVSAILICIAILILALTVCVACADSYRRLKDDHDILKGEVRSWQENYYTSSLLARKLIGMTPLRFMTYEQRHRFLQELLAGAEVELEY